ncbi:MAG: NAD(P)/FAD-dependent oxidoreductase, partial [Methanosarcinales archaeon]|nr:NAD(P)/FAD-dependent oxidoreductase [Methanosarcinales archaeon]
GNCIGPCVRSIRICPGIPFCKRGKQDSLSLGLKLDEKYHGMPMPAKVKMAVSGCTLSCSESLVRDIGFTADANGFKLYVGGSAGAMPRIGNLVAEGLSEEESLELTERIIVYLKEKKSNKRIGKLIDEIGLDEFKAGIGI